MLNHAGIKTLKKLMATLETLNTGFQTIYLCTVYRAKNFSELAFAVPCMGTFGPFCLPCQV